MIETYLRQYEATAANGGSRAPDWVRSLRADSIERFREAGFPGPKDEEWRFTPLAPLVRANFGPAEAGAAVILPEIEPFLFDRADWPRLVLVNGRFRADLSQLPPMPP